MRLLWTKRDGLWWFVEIGPLADILKLADIRRARGEETMISYQW